MRNRIYDRTKKSYTKIIRDIVSNLGRKVLVYKTPKKIECGNCYYDTLTESSSGKCKWTVPEASQKQADYESSGGTDLKFKYFIKGRCPICKGKGALEIARKVWVDAIVNWAPNPAGNDALYTPAGSEGATTVQLKLHPKHTELFKDCDKLVIDDIECKLSSPPIPNGIGMNAVIIVEAFTTEIPKPITSKPQKEYR